MSVKIDGGDTVTCTYPAAADLSAFHTGDKVTMRCNLVSSPWQLSRLASSTATDVSQDVWTKVWQALPAGFRGGPSA